ncbi:unnamed protein product, partial [marine sediment metagenome]
FFITIINIGERIIIIIQIKIYWVNTMKKDKNIIVRTIEFIDGAIRTF